MAVAAPSQIGTNPYLNPSLTGPPPALGEIGPETRGRAPEAEEQTAAPEAAAIDLKTALNLAEAVTGDLKARPGWLTLRIHSPNKPSLLGANYA